MFKQPCKTFVLILLTLVLLLAVQVSAQDGGDRKLNQAQAVQKAQQQVKGRVLKVRQSKNKYQIKVLQKSGRVVTVDVDKNSGRVSKSR